MWTPTLAWPISPHVRICPVLLNVPHSFGRIYGWLLILRLCILMKFEVKLTYRVNLVLALPSGQNMRCSVNSADIAVYNSKLVGTGDSFIAIIKLSKCWDSNSRLGLFFISMCAWNFLRYRKNTQPIRMSETRVLCFFTNLYVIYM